MIGLGGTIAMARDGGGITPRLSVESLLAEIDGGADAIGHDLAQTASANLGWGDLFALRDLLLSHRREGGRGAVVIQGTDTLEETAFIAELLGCGLGGPLVFTGAMRGADAPGADGPANLAAALVIARDAPADLGVVVALDDLAHAARRVRKTHTLATGAFASGDGGALARVGEGRMELLQPPLPALPCHDVSTAPRAVAMATLSFACGPEVLAGARADGVRGCILQALGAGHAPAALVTEIADLAQRMPVVLCSRTGDGRVAERTYGYPGGEIDLLGRGVISGGRLAPSKARVALQLCLASTGVDARQAFADIVEACR